MLTERAYRERKWGKYPTLRTILEDKALPSLYYGYTSVSDNGFARIPRLMEIASLALENQEELLNYADQESLPKVLTDLNEIEFELRETARYFESLQQQICAIRGRLAELGYGNRP